MARDGTARGGSRPGAGRKKAMYNESEPVVAPVLSLPHSDLTGEAADIDGQCVPPVHEFMKASQKNGKTLMAHQIYNEVSQWISKNGCSDLINPLMIEQYSMAFARWVQCENAISEYGMIAKHPTTGAPCASPYVTMGQNYLKQANNLWFQIYQIVKANSGTGSDELDPMEQLLRMSD